MIYVELWFDIEKDQSWKITLWQIHDLDFDPFVVPYLTLDICTDNQHIAREIQLAIVRDLKQQTQVIANAYSERSRFEIRPKWYEELLSPIGHVLNNCYNRVTRDKEETLVQVRETYQYWMKETV